MFPIVNSLLVNLCNIGMMEDNWELQVVDAKLDIWKEKKKKQEKGARSKKLKYEIMREDWGREHKMEQKNAPKQVSLFPQHPCW